MFELEDIKLVHEQIKQFKNKDDLAHQLPSTWEKLAKLNTSPSNNFITTENTETLVIDKAHMQNIKEFIPSIHKFIENWKDEILMHISYNQKVVEKQIDELIMISEKIKIDGKDIEQSYALVLFEILQQCFKKTNSHFKQQTDEQDFYH